MDPNQTATICIATATTQLQSQAATTRQSIGDSVTTLCSTVAHSGFGWRKRRSVHGIKTNTGGRPRWFSALTITTARLAECLFSVSPGSLQGFIDAIFFTGTLATRLPKRHLYSSTRQACCRLVSSQNNPASCHRDTTGLKVHGEGEWIVHKNGTNENRRGWQKRHGVVDIRCHERVVAALNLLNVTDTRYRSAVKVTQTNLSTPH